MNDDLKHTNEFGEVEAFKDTKYWFKKDLQTIRKSSIEAFKISPVIFLITFIFSLLTTRLNNIEINLNLALLYGAILSPILMLGYIMFRVIFNKGYDIDPYKGTHINMPKHAKRFSARYILSSNMSPGRKIMFLLRLAIYFLLCIGLALYILMSFNK